MNVEDWINYNEDIKLDCPDCGDVWYGEDCPTTCTTCWCECGQGKMSLRHFLKEYFDYSKGE